MVFMGAEICVILERKSTFKLTIFKKDGVCFIVIYSFIQVSQNLMQKYTYADFFTLPISFVTGTLKIFPPKIINHGHLLFLGKLWLPANMCDLLKLIIEESSRRDPPYFFHARIFSDSPHASIAEVKTFNYYCNTFSCYELNL